MSPIIELELFSKTWLVLDSEQRFLQITQKLPSDFSIVKEVPIHLSLSANTSMPSTLSDVFRFSEMMQRSEYGSNLKILCAGVDPVQHVASAFLLACHFILWNGLGFEEAYLVFKPISETIEQCIGIVAFTNSLRALCCAKCLDWIDFRRDSEIETKYCQQIEMGKLVHYSRYSHLTKILDD